MYSVLLYVPPLKSDLYETYYLFSAREDMLRVRKLVSISHIRRQATADQNNGPPPSQRATDSFSAVRT